MDNKEIIIDEVDVSDCEHLEYKGCEFPQCLIKTASFDLKCEGYNCYLKRYKRKEQECEELQSNVNHLVVARNKLKEFLKQSFTKNEKYKQALESIEEYFKSKDKRKTSLFNISVIEQEILNIINKG